MADCIFCKIIASEIPSANVYEDEQFLAFLDINPVAPGHTLLIPKAHHPMMADLPDELIGPIYQAAKQLMQRIKAAMAADFVALSVVGVDMPHFHIHLIPRRSGDGLANFWPTRTYAEGELDRVAAKIRDAS